MVENITMKTTHVFKKSGKQGITGLVEIEKQSFVFKIEQSVGNLMKHESLVMKDLNRIRAFCPHFCIFENLVDCKVYPNYYKYENPLIEPSEEEPKIIIKCLIMEYIKGSSLYRFIKSSKFEGIIFSSILKQLLMALIISQTHVQFTHYDLHSSNILLEKCDKDRVHLYVLDENNQFFVSTRGKIPKIIDFGYSHSRNISNNSPLYCSLAYTHVGFISSVFDSYADCKLLLVTLLQEITKYQTKWKKAKKFKNIVKNILKHLPIQWDSGWDYNQEMSAIGYIEFVLDNCQHESIFMKKHLSVSLDIMQNLIELPLKSNSYTDIVKIFRIIAKEFSNIEMVVRNSQIHTFILQIMVKAAREIREEYNSEKYKDVAVVYFKRAIQETMSNFGDFCNPKLNYEKLLCSLLIFSDCMEGILYEIITSRVKEKEEEYLILENISLEDIFAMIDVNLDEDYIFNKNSSVHVFDCISQTETEFQLSDNQVSYINNVHSILKGSVLYDMFLEKKK